MPARLEALPAERDAVSSIPDERLALLFTCCHPALAAEARVALTLREVAGLTTAEIARAFFVAEPAMGSGSCARSGRSAADRTIVLLDDQDRSRWSRPRIEEGTRVLERALSRRSPGTYQVQAAIAALHLGDATDWAQIAALYERLELFDASPVVALNHAVAVAMAEGPERGLALVGRIELPEYHLLHAARADLLRRLGRNEDAAAAYRDALALEMNTGDRTFLERRLVEVT